MPETLTLLAPGPLLATADPRVKRGLLLPWSEFGLTNKGKVTASRGVLTLAEKARQLTLEHSDKLPVAEFASFDEDDQGLWASVRYLNTPLGNAGLAEFEEGTRTGLSVEVDDPVIRAGALVGGVIAGGSQVETPAFPSARLAASELDDAPDLGDTAVPVPAVVIDGETLPDVESVEITPAVPDDGGWAETVTITTKAAQPANDKEGNTMAAAQVQNPALMGKTKPDTSPATLYATLAHGFAAGQQGTKLEAALTDIVPANILGIEQPQYIGQIWAGQPYERRIIPCFDHSDLTSFTINGWDWGTKPTVGLYAGGKAEIPSAAVTTVPKDGVLQRIAGGHDIDRKFRDFGNSEFWAAYFDAMAESYAKVSDTYVRGQVVANIPAGAQRQHLAAAGAPAGVPTVLWQIVEGCVKMIDDLDTLPTFAIVTSDYWKPLFYTKQNDVLAYLNMSLGLKEGSLEAGGFKIVPVPVGSLTNGAWVGKTVIGHRSALKVYELPGAPIRVSAEDVAKGGIDEALFGYCGYMLENAKGLISYDTPS